MKDEKIYMSKKFLYIGMNVYKNEVKYFSPNTYINTLKYNLFENFS